MNYPLIIGIQSGFTLLLITLFLIFRYRIKREVGANSSLTEQIKNKEGELSSIKKEFINSKTIFKDLENEIKIKNEEIDKATAYLKKISPLIHKDKKEYQQFNEETSKLQNLQKNASQLVKDVRMASEQLGKTSSQIQLKRQELKKETDNLNKMMSRIDLYSQLDEYVAYGHFEEPDYLYETSARFTEEIKRIREKQKELLKTKNAITYPDSLTISVDPKEDKKILTGQINLMLTAFNINCDLLISKVKPSNFARTLEQIEKLAEKLEKSAASFHCGFNTEYVKIKYEECRLQYQYSLKNQEEKEEQRLIKERMREEVKAQKEYERAIAIAEKEERMYRKMLEKAKESLGKATEDERIVAEQRIEDLEQQLAEAIKKEERAKSLAEQTRRGHVYVISNVGSFGEGVYKIGLTRRLDPLDRVKELGDASVPFKFDVHAIIYADDAPALESSLHQEFKHRRVNAVNFRKEFFEVDLPEIKAAAESIVGNEIDFQTTMLAEEYNETKRLQRDFTAGPKRIIATKK